MACVRFRCPIQQLGAEKCRYPIMLMLQPARSLTPKAHSAVSPHLCILLQAVMLCSSIRLR